MTQQTEFIVVLGHFLPFNLLNNLNNNILKKLTTFWKNEKNPWKYDHFILLYHKW